jgi:homoaconitase/3-isopropylmalate dehydratase large subunit
MDRIGFKVLLIAFDEKTHHYVQNHMNGTRFGSELISYHWRGVKGDDAVTEEATTFRTKQFNLMSNHKLESVLAIMEAGYDVIFTDVDIAIARDPIPFLIWDNVDYVHSVNKICKP